MRHLCCPYLATFACLCCAATAASSAASIDEIQVTATRRTTNLSDISIAVTVVGAEQLDLGNLATDALAGQAGAFLQETTPGQGAVVVRGMKGSEVLHLVDSMRLNNAIFRNAPTQYAALVDPKIVERVEVARGSISSLYGSDVMGGAVNFITDKPEFFDAGSGYRGDAHMSASSADLSKALSIGVEAGSHSMAGLARFSTLDAGKRRAGGASQRTPFTAYSYDAARLALRGTASDRRSWFVDLQYLQQPNTDRVDELIPGYGQSEPQSSEFSFKPNERAFAHVQYELQQGIWSADWRIDLGWQQITDDKTVRGFGSDTRRLERNSSDLLTLSIEGVRETSNRVWVFGAEHQFDRVRSARDEVDIATGSRSSVAARFPDDSSISQSGLYARLQLAAGARGNLSVGGRLAAVDIEIPRSVMTGAANVQFTDLTGDFGWTYDMTDEWILVANLGRGFRAPNIFDLGALGERPGNRFNIPNDGLSAETVIHYDAGVRRVGTAFSGELRVFALHYKDKIESVDTGAITPEGRQITQSRNLSSVNVEGIEISAEIMPSENLVVAAFLNFARGDARLAGDPATPADRIPPLNGQLQLTWDIGRRWRLNTYVRFAAPQDRLSIRDQTDARINPDGTAGWATANIQAMYGLNDRIDLSITVENILDKKYRVHGSGLDARGINAIGSINIQW